ncbi:MAG: GNAT family N-acetyltransferase [Clostridiales bacterium]|nr:GNAT family N-acetyltransferase [Clostridiales bacterium]
MENKGCQEGNTPDLHTAQLLLRKFTLEDLPAYYQLMKDPKVNRFLPWFPMESMEEAQEHLQKRYLHSYCHPVGFRYALCLQEDNIPIGYVNISNPDSYDLGYGLRKEHWGKGYTTQGVKAVVAQAKKMGIPYITATHDIDNPASGRVMEKIGMTYCYTYRELWQPKNKLVTYRLYQLNIDGNNERVYWRYWEKYPDHYIEQEVSSAKAAHV